MWILCACARVCGICLSCENKSKSMLTPLLCFAVPSLATSSHWSALSFSLQSLFLLLTHTVSSVPTVSSDSISALRVCVCQPDVVHELARCMLEPEELSEAVQCFLRVRRELPYVELVLIIELLVWLLVSPVTCDKSCLTTVGRSLVE